jgi:hypothetical protein
MRPMFERPRCRCPRCTAKRQIRYLAVCGLGVAIAAGYFIITDHPETVPDTLLEASGKLIMADSANGASRSAGNAGSVSAGVPVTSQAPADSMIAGDHLNSSMENDDSSKVLPDRIGSNARSESIPSQAIDPSSRTPTRPSSLPQTPTRLPAMVAGSDPFFLFPAWLTKVDGETPGESPHVSVDKAEAALPQEKSVAGPGSSAPESSPRVASGPESEAFKMTEPFEEKSPEPVLTSVPPASLPAVAPAQADPRDISVSATPVDPLETRNDSPAVVPASPAEKNKPADIALASSAGSSGPTPQQTKKPDLVSRSTPQPALPSESNVNQFSENGKKETEPKLAGTLASFVAMQGNELVKSPPSPERPEPQGYITVESKPESVRSGTSRTRSSKPADRRSKTETDPAEAPDNPPESQETVPNRGDNPARPDHESVDLQRFASDFVRTDQTGSIAEQHRFYADSVRFYTEGDLSWAGVAAATQRYHREKRNRRYGAAAPATVKGPVNGGFYVVDQQVSWSQTDGPRPTRGRSILRLRVVPTGRGGWKITSIEEIGQ